MNGVGKRRKTVVIVAEKRNPLQFCHHHLSNSHEDGVQTPNDNSSWVPDGIYLAVIAVSEIHYILIWPKAKKIVWNLIMRQKLS